MTNARAGVKWLTPLAFVLFISPPVFAAQAAGGNAPGEPVASAGLRLAQFQLPDPATQGGPPRPVTQFLKYQYAYGSESDITYRTDPDLDKRVRDNSLIAAPQLNGYILYRPGDSLETMLEMILEREYALQEESAVLLPSGATQTAPRRRPSLVVDQSYVRYKTLGPFDITLGRRNFEDDRHWLYDTSLDSIHALFRQDAWRAELSFSRKDLWDLDLLRNAPTGKTGYYMLYLDYRGIEDMKLAGYTIHSHDRAGNEGKPVHTGARAYGMPSDSFNYWAELSFLNGWDELNRSFSARGVDVGGTYRFTDLPLYPSVTLGYAYATGDGNPDDGRNHEFRQTGLQSNEIKAGGVSKFKYYGEALDPELSNLKIFTVGFGLRPTPSVYVDLVYHRYRLDELAGEIRNWALTAEMNQVDTHLSKDVGSAIDIILGLRNLFGVRRFGLDFRAGWFFPGAAFFRNDGDDIDPDIRGASDGFSIIAKFWY